MMAGGMEGHESGIDIRRDDGTLDVSFNWIARNREVHFTVEIEAVQGLSKTIVDLTPEEAYEIAGAFKAAARAVDGPVQVTFPRPASVGHVLGERD